MFLSNETNEGLHVAGCSIMFIPFICTCIYTVESFLEVGPFLLQQPGVKFLYSATFSQDPWSCFLANREPRVTVMITQRSSSFVMQLCH